MTICSTTHACACMTYKQQNSHSAPKMFWCSISQLSRPKHPATSPCFTSAMLPYNTAGATPSQGHPHHRVKTGLGLIKALSTQKPAQRSISTQNFEILLAETLLLIHQQVLPRLLTLLLKIFSGFTSESISAGSPFTTRSSKCWRQHPLTRLFSLTMLTHPTPSKASQSNFLQSIWKKTRKKIHG